MRQHTYLTIALLLLCTLAFGQANVTLPTYNILSSADYTIKAEVLSLYVTQYTLRKNNDESSQKQFTLNPNTPESFSQNFIEKFKVLAAGDELLAKAGIGSPETNLEREAKHLFFSFMAAERAIESVQKGPTAGKLCFDDTVSIELENIDEFSLKAMRRDKKKKIKACAKMENQVRDATPFCVLKRFKRERPRFWKNRIDQYHKDSITNAVIKEIRATEADMKENQNKIIAIRQKIEAEESRYLNGKKKYDEKLIELTKTQDGILTTKTLLATFINAMEVTPLMKGFTVRSDTFSVIYPALDQYVDKANKVLNDRASSLQESLKDTNDTLAASQRFIKEDSVRQIRYEQGQLSQLKENAKKNYENETKLKHLEDRAKTLISEIKTIDSKTIQSHKDTVTANTIALNKLLKEKDQINLLLESQRQRQPIAQFGVEAIDIEFNDGFIENIQVLGKVVHEDVNENKESLDNLLKFDNRSPIGFSSKNNFRNRHLLFASASNGNHYQLALNKLLPVYMEKLHVDRRDFSPKDYVFSFDFKSGEKCQEVLKDETSKLFEAKVYSDFVGLTNDREPNGLVQTEISKKINMNTNRRAFRLFWINWLNTTAGIFGYLEPEITLSKIENNNRSLLLNTKDRIENNQYVPLKFASTLELRRYQNFSVGFDFNVFTFDIPAGKSTLYVDGGFRYGRTDIRDSIRSFTDNRIVQEKLADEYGVNTLDIYPKVIWEIRSDERYCFRLTYSHHWSYLRDNRFEQVGNTDVFNTTEDHLKEVNKEFTKIGLYATLNPSNDLKGKLFFRYHYFWQQGFWRTGFHQAQVGYSFYILARKQ